MDGTAAVPLRRRGRFASAVLPHAATQPGQGSRIADGAQNRLHPRGSPNGQLRRLPPYTGQRQGHVEEVTGRTVHELDEVEGHGERYVLRLPGGQDHLVVKHSRERLASLDEQGPVHANQARVHRVVLGVRRSEMDVEGKGEILIRHRRSQARGIGQTQVREGPHPVQLDAGETDVGHAIEGEVHIPERHHLLQGGAPCHGEEQDRAREQAENGHA